MGNFCDNPECINNKQYDSDEITIKEHGSDFFKSITKEEVISSSGDPVWLCSACMNAIKMICSENIILTRVTIK